MRRLSIAFVAVGWMVACSSSDSSTPTTTNGNNTTSTDAGTNVQGDAGVATPTCSAGTPCADGAACTAPNDCTSGYCVKDTCVPKGCADGVKDNDETDVDCGGSCILGCAPGAACAANTDCLDGTCLSTLTCKPPTKGDGLKNGNESDVDCGSSTAGRFDTKAARCDAGKTCAADVDCKSAGCNIDTKTCAFARSCATTNGGTSCGAGDSTSASASHEDCCTSAEVAPYTNGNFTNSATFRLDKYTITAGRMRKFLDAVKGNVQGWVKANRANIVAPTQLPDTLDPYLPQGWVQADSATDVCYSDVDAQGKPTGTYPCNYGALAQMSGYRYNNEPGGNGGYACDMTAGGYGARTFHLTDAELAQFGDGEIQHSVPAERLAEKALECTNYYMLAAFCAWDGGRLETLDEYNAAYGGDGTNGSLYPWQAKVTAGTTNATANNTATATRALGFYDAENSNIYPNYNYLPAAWPASGADPGADAQCGTDCTAAQLGGGTTRYSVYNPHITQADANLLITRLRRANGFYNYGNYITTDFFQTLEAVAQQTIEKSEVKAEEIDQQNDQTVIVAPPGRYVAGRGAIAGHSDLIGNVIEITASVVGGGAPTPTTQMTWARNGSYETAHLNQQTMTGSTFQKAMLTKYARAGGRCARPVGIYMATPLP